MNIQKFREDLRKRLSETGKSQLRLSIDLELEQASISRFLSGKSGLSGEAILKLWAFVYELPPQTN